MLWYFWMQSWITPRCLTARVQSWFLREQNTHHTRVYWLFADSCVVQKTSAFLKQVWLVPFSWFKSFYSCSHRITFLLQNYTKNLQRKSFSYTGGGFPGFVQWLVLFFIEISASLFSLTLNFSRFFFMQGLHFCCYFCFPSLRWTQHKGHNDSLISFKFTCGIR